MTAEDMIARAIALRPRIVAEQAQTEERRYFSPELHEAFHDAGVYRLYVPKRYGGYEFDVPTFVRVVEEIARGCVSTAWCLGLSMNHALQVGSWWPQSAQDAIFGDGEFIASSVAAPVGTATPTDDGWRIDGQVAYASGSPYATHYMGQALGPPETEGGPPTLLGFVAPRDQWEMLDDWGHLIGLKGSGSHSLRFEAARIPADWALPLSMNDVEVTGGTPGTRLHGNAMYGGRGMAIFTLSLAAITVGGVFNALDAYEELMRTKQTPIPPFRLRVEDPEFHHGWYGRALTRALFLQAALHDTARRHMELCRRAFEEGAPYTYGDDMLLGNIAREIIIESWETMQRDIWQTVGASATGDDSRITRVFRDLSVAVAHRNAQLRDFGYGEVAREVLGQPRIMRV